MERLAVDPMHKTYRTELLFTGCGIPAGAGAMPAWGLRVASASLAAVTSLVRRAMTRQAASC